MGGAAGAATHDPCDTPSVPWSSGAPVKPSGCFLSGWSKGLCTTPDPSDPAWACVEATQGCKPDQTCFLGVAIVGECPPDATVRFSCKGLDGKMVVVTKPLPSYTVCTDTNPCTEVTSGFVCAKESPNSSGLADPSITINGKTCTPK